MNDKTKEQTRIEFEQNFTSRYTAHKLGRMMTMGGDLADEYKDPRVNYCWVLWQAAHEMYAPSGAVEFARHMFTQVWPEGGIDGGELQDLGERFGLLKPAEVAERCGEGCRCADYDSFPQTCYKLNLIATPNGGNGS